MEKSSCSKLHADILYRNGSFMLGIQQSALIQ